MNIELKFKIEKVEHKHADDCPACPGEHLETAYTCEIEDLMIIGHGKSALESMMSAVGFVPEAFEMWQESTELKHMQEEDAARKFSIFKFLMNDFEYDRGFKAIIVTPGKDGWRVTENNK